MTPVDLPTTASRADAIEHVATTLVPRASMLTRLFLRNLGTGLSRAEGSLLRALTAGPRRITELAESEALAQPTITQLVHRLEDRGYVKRERHPDDGRVVMVTLTEAGSDALEAYRERYRAVVRDQLAGMSDDQLNELVAATDSLQGVIEAMQR
jgi:DNA-binding MarR family transcriptional regulator